MAGLALPQELATQFMAMAQQTANLVQGHLTTVHKELDLDYAEGKRQVSLVQALGAREVGSRVNPAGPSPA